MKKIPIIVFIFLLTLFGCSPANNEEKKPDDVEVEVKSISVNSTEVTMLVSEKYVVIAKSEPDVPSSKLMWSSSNTAVATVVNGTVEALSRGTAVITVYADNGVSKTLEVIVNEKETIVKSEVSSVVDAKVTEYFGDFTLKFSLKDNLGKYVIEKATVKIEVTNSSGKNVYSGDHFIEKEFFFQNTAEATVMADYFELGNNSKDTEGTFKYTVIVGDKKFEQKSVKIVGLPIKEQVSESFNITTQEAPFEVNQMYNRNIVNKYIINEMKITKNSDGTYYVDIKATKTYDWAGTNAATMITVNWKLENDGKVYLSDSINFTKNILVTQDFSFRINLGKISGNGFKLIIY